MRVKRTIRLSANENPYGPGRLVRRALEGALERVSEYPDVASLTCDIAARWNLPDACATVGTGGDDILRRAVEQTDGPVVAAWPGFGVYRDLADARGRAFVPVTLAGDGSADAANLVAVGRSLSEKGPPGVIFAANPNNPTGTGTSRDALADVARSLPGWLVIVDEAYAEFRDVPDPETLPTGWPEGAVIARTLSKLYGLAGLRVGYAVGRGWGIERLVRYGDSIPVGTLTVAAARAALAPGNAARLRRVRRLVIARRHELIGALKKRGFSVHPSETNFVLATPPGACDADGMANTLRAMGVMVRMGSRLGVPGTIRISVGAGWQHRALYAALDEVMGDPLRPAGRPVCAGS